MTAISTTNVRYVKLGRAGGWVEVSLARGELHFGYGSATHELSLQGDLEKIKQHLISVGRGTRAASRDAQEVIDFYQMGADCLWITFARGYLWWTFAEPEVFWISDDLNVAGERMRKSIGGWRNTDVNGVTLDVHTLSTKLTKVANYRRTICAVEAQDYLLRRINGIVEPIVTQSIEARNALLEVTTKALTLLDWSDFETLVDIIFSRMGWNRMSRLGGAQALVDLELELPIINE
jgi:hypothetical protein